MTSDGSDRTRGLLDREEVESVLSGAFYSPSPTPKRAAKREQVKAEHYKIICISLYNEDLQKMDEMVDALKARGLTKASRSALIRHALSLVDVERVPRGI